MPYTLEVQYQSRFGFKFDLAPEPDAIADAIYPNFFYECDLHHEAIFAPSEFADDFVAVRAEHPDFFYQSDKHHESVFARPIEEAIEDTIHFDAVYPSFFYQRDLHHPAFFVGRVFDPLSGDFIKPALFPDFLVFEEDYQSGLFFAPGFFEPKPVEPFTQGLQVYEWQEHREDPTPFWGFIFGQLHFNEDDSESVQTVTKLDVFNIAALALGFAEGVTDPDEQTAVASVLRKRWTTARRSFLEEHPYNGCKRTAVLAKKTTPPVDRWTSMYTLPYDCLRVMTINGMNQIDGTDSWEIEYDVQSEERVLLTDASTATAAMIVDVEDLTHLKTKVIEAMGLYLAYMVNEVFPMSTSKRSDLKLKMDHAVSMTKGTDGQEGTPPRRTQSTLVTDMKRGRRGRRRR